MTITTRAGKGSALTHTELDGNFTDLNGRVTTIEGGSASLSDGTGSLNISKAIINATETLDDPRLVTRSTAYDGVQFERVVTGVGTRTTYVCLTEFTDNGHTTNQGTGIWSRIKTTDGLAEIGGIYNKFETVTDSSNYTGSVEFVPNKVTAGSNSYSSVLTLSQDKVVIQNTGAVYIQNLPTTDPTSAGQLWNDSGTLKVSAG